MKMSDSSSESQDEAVTYTKGKKLKRTAKSMRLMISDEETKYRNKKFKNVDVISDHGDKLQCTKCLCSIKSSVVEGRDVYSHPLLKVLLCKKCIDYYGNGDFSLDEDDEDKYCRWCGEGGTLFLCSKCICGFCPKCIKKHFGKEKKKLIENDDDWTCFFCKPDWLYDLRAICALALDAANKNKKELRSKRESKLTSMTKKGASTRAKPGRRSVRTSSPNTSTSEKGNSSEPAEVILSSTEEEKPSEKEKNKTPKIALKRKRGSKGTPKVNGKASGIDTLSEGTESDGRGTKKRKASPKVASPVKPTPKPKEKDAEPKKKKVESDSSSESEGEAATTITAPSKQVAKSLGKLTDLFKLTEMTAQLCLDVCKKHLKKLENKNIVVTNEKLIKESEKLKSVVTMLSTNLTTVSSTVSSLQNKLGVDEKDEDDSQTNNEKSKLNDAIGELKRCSDMINEALKDEFNLLEEEEEGDGTKEKEKENENDADDDDSEKDSVKSEVISSDKNSKKKKKGKKKTRKKESEDEEWGKGSGDERKSKKMKKKKSKRRRKGSDDDGSEKKVENKDDKESERKSKKLKKESDDEGKKSDGSEKGDKSEEVKEKVVDEEKNGSEVSDGNGNDEVVDDNIPKTDDESVEKACENKKDQEKEVDENESKKEVLRSSSSDEEEPLAKKKSSSNNSSDDKEEPLKKKKERRKKSDDEKEKTKKSSGEEDDEEEKAKKPSDCEEDDANSGDEKKKKAQRKKSSDVEEGDEKEPPKEEVKEKSSDAETESEEEVKCDKIVTKDEIKLREVKITLKRIELPKDCDSISLNESKDIDAYDVDTEVEDDDEDEKDKIKKKVLKSSSDEDESLDTKKSKKRKKLLDSDEEEFKVNSASDDEKAGSSDDIQTIESDSDDAFLKKKSKKKSESEESNSDDAKKSKWRRIRSKKNEKSESSSDSEQERTRKRSRKKEDKDDKDSPSKGRKNIKRIIKKDKLHVETKQALKNEEARKERLKERQKEYDKLFPVEKDESGKQKRLVLDFDPETKEPTVEVHSKLVKKLKPHQIEGVKFMWDSCFESIKKMEEESGSGCILAHCMGLGKTLQVITLVHTVMTHDLGVNTTLVVCPLNTVANWIQEFEMWLANIHTDPITLYDIIKYKKDYERTFQLNDWHKNGGVMVISYDMFRNLTKEKKIRKSKKKDQGIFDKTLIDPGPDLVICDEGHLLKNEDTALSKCMRRIATSRRIVLTGTPLQNNLVEYHCMVQFIKPNILGTKKEFLNRFVNPINNGQFEDSTEWDVKVMKRRSHVLHTMLDGCVQRFDYSVLTPFLPKKYEYVISIPLSESQAKLYKYYLDHFSAKSEGVSRGARLFNDYHHLQRIWTHPHTLLQHDEKEEVRKLLRDDESEGSLKDFVVDDSEDEAESTGSGSGSGSDSEPKPERKRLLRSTANDEDVRKEIEEIQQIQQIKEKKWWDEFITEQDYEDLRASYKLVLLFSILRESKKLGDKVLVFSQSLYTLDLIEYFLERIDMASKKNPNELLDGHADSWKLGKDYFRLDGSTSSEKRHIYTKYFNKDKNKDARLFLISTRAGGLGINLTAANRVIIFDASWNPSHDVQSIFRVYRFGQTKTCYIYRFLAEATMEEKIYERQVTKLSLAHRVVDEHQIERHYTMNSLVELYAYDPTPPEKRKTPMVPKDEMFADILTKHKEIIVGYHEHDSLLENKQEEVLTEEERKAAWEDFEKERTARPNIDIAQLQQQQIAYQRFQQLQQQQQQLNNLPNMQNLNFNNPAFVGAVRDNMTRLINPLAMQANPLAMQANQLMMQANPMAMSSNPVQGNVISNTMLQRGNLVGIRPFPSETAQSYFNRIRDQENNMVRQQQALMLLQQLQNSQIRPNQL